MLVQVVAIVDIRNGSARAIVQDDLTHQNVCMHRVPKQAHRANVWLHEQPTEEIKKPVGQYQKCAHMQRSYIEK